MVDGPVGVVGAGYVGLTTAACLAHLDHRVRCVDVDVARVEALRRGRVPLAEPGLAELVDRGTHHGGTVVRHRRDEPARHADRGAVRPDVACGWDCSA